jgi:hypothetical protein
MLRPFVAAMLAVMFLGGGAERAEAKPERPEFTVVSEEGNFEIRDYGAIVLAQFTMRGTYKQSVSYGYIRLERYFTGENAVPEPIDRTVPTMVRDDLAGGWTTIFVMPVGYRPETAPPPNDRRIRIVELPARRAAVIKFPGKLNERVMREQVGNLEAWLAARGMAHRGDFTLAGYSTPWTPKRMRKNEVIVTLK